MQPLSLFEQQAYSGKEETIGAFIIEMPKVKKEKECYRSMDNSRKPNCRKFSSTLCHLCHQADIRYSTRREEILQIRKMKNRQSAMQSRDNYALKWDDLLAENFALEQEDHEADKALFDIGQERQRLLTAIHNKSLERAWRVDQVAIDISRFIVQNPDETIVHLRQTFGNTVSYQQDIHGDMPVPEVISVTEPVTPKHQPAGANSRVLDPHVVQDD